LASQAYSYYALFNYALMPSLQQFNKILSHEISLMLDDSLTPADDSLAMDVPMRRRVLEQLGVSIFNENSPLADGFNHSVSIDLMSEEMSQELGSPTEVRMGVGPDSYVLWMKIDLLPGQVLRIPLSELQEEDFAPLFRNSIVMAV
ncbi:two-component system sensor histidine kinase EnvZ, partial [Vibrio diabolicus]|nr:two-component system sensor histidine kinase EnvZ [Vibrio diabolicus]